MLTYHLINKAIHILNKVVGKMYVSIYPIYIVWIHITKFEHKFLTSKILIKSKFNF